MTIPPRPAAFRQIPRCPVCGKPAGDVDAPFCSRGCRDRDLLQWLSEGYRLPVGNDDEDGVDSGRSSD